MLFDNLEQEYRNSVRLPGIFWFFLTLMCLLILEMAAYSTFLGGSIFIVPERSLACDNTTLVWTVPEPAKPIIYYARKPILERHIVDGSPNARKKSRAIKRSVMPRRIITVRIKRKTGDTSAQSPSKLPYAVPETKKADPAPGFFGKIANYIGDLADRARAWENDRERAEQLKNLRLPCGSAKLPLLVNWLNLIIFAVCTIFFSTIFYFLKKMITAALDF